MLRLWKTPTQPESPSAREDLFLGRYERLYGWALQITGNDPQKAEDLVHDAFIQFTLRLSDISDIQNLDGYLYGMLRNIHLAEMRRRAVRMQKQLLSAADYDSAEVGLRADDARDQIVLQDQLRRICHYACVRKSSSKAGSVLILRFFHGYYPGEIAELTRNSRRAVEHSLSIARAEARVYLENPASLRFMTGISPAAPRTGFALGLEDFLKELQAGIFRSREGQCLSKKDLTDLYRKSADDFGAVDCAQLAHFVSCPRCIETINWILGLASLSDRYPTDKLGTDTSNRGGSGGTGGSNRSSGGGMRGGGGPGSPDLPDSTVKRLRRKRRNVFEHCPRELRVSVNGYVLGSQKIGLDFNELTLSLKVEEKVSFVEVVSEQEIRLLLMEVHEPPPEGAYEQAERVALSDGRLIEATLSFTAPWSTLTVVYRDPNLSPAEASDSALVDPDPYCPLAVLPAGKAGRNPSMNGRMTRGRFNTRVFGVLGRLWSHEFWLSPRTLLVMVSVVVVMLLLFGRTPKVGTVSAATLLNRSIELADNLTGTERVVHQGLTLEARKAATGEVVLRRRIELWRSPEKGLEAKRVFDENGHLVGGEWRRADGSETIYRINRAPEEIHSPDLPAEGESIPIKPGWVPNTQVREREGKSILADELWRLDLSPAEFVALIGDTSAARADTRPGEYLITYIDKAGAKFSGLSKATLVLGRDDLHATEQSLTVERGNESFEYRFEESSIERRSSGSVPASIFEPDAELLGPTAKHKEPPAKAPAAKGPERPKAVATVGLEVKVLDLLYQAGADMGEQVSVERTPGGKLLVAGILENDQRKGEILRSLLPVSHDPAVRLDVSTITEAVRQQQRGRQRPQATPAALTAVTIEGVDGGGASIPVESELNRYLASRTTSSGRVDPEEIRQFAVTELHRSGQVMMHAYALKGLVNRFSVDDLKTLDPESRSKWLGMVRSHAAALAAGLAGLRQDLTPLFSPSATKSDSSTGLEITSDDELVSQIQRLFQLSSSADRTVRSAFSISPDPSGAVSIKGFEFWHSLTVAEAIAAKIAAIQ